MISVLYIGQYEKAGRFTAIQWRYFLEWCKTECNRIIVYSRVHFNVICTKFPLYCNIHELESPDEDLGFHAYEINIVDIMFWAYFKDFDFSIDKEGEISHILIEEPISHEEKLLLERELLWENIQFCIKGKSDIKELVQEEIWKPLGA